MALSSGESELYAIGMATAESLWTRNLLQEALFCKACTVTLHTDSTSARAMALRFGTGKKVKHVQLRYLFMQELHTEGYFKLKKVATARNCSDTLTKYVDRDTLHRHLRTLGLEPLVFYCIAT